MSTHNRLRPEKSSFVKELTGYMKDSVFVILTDYKGLTVAKTAELRGKLGEVSAQFHVGRNGMIRHAARDLNLPSLDAGLNGPTAIVTGTGDVVAAAKILKDFVAEHKLPVVKIGAMNGVVLSESDIAVLASLPSRTELLGKFVGTVAAPLTSFVGVLNQKVCSLLYVLKAVQEKKSAA